MKKRYLVIVGCIGVVFVMFAVGIVIAETTTCYDLESEICVTATSCLGNCSPECGDVLTKVPYNVDKCKCKATGKFECEGHPTDTVSCYNKYPCQNSTATCTSDAGADTGKCWQG
jgi:hypothetical protein